MFLYMALHALVLMDSIFIRLAPVLKTIFHLYVISYTCSQSNSEGSILEPLGLDWLQVYDMTH